MATYESLIKIKGAVGNLVFYDLNGKNVVRKKSGFNMAAFKKSPSYEKVRQNSSEFGHCSKIGKVIRKALEKYILLSEDPLLYQQFAKLMTEIKDLDLVSERGQRTVEKGLETEKGKFLLKTFTFGKKQNMDTETSILHGQNIHLKGKYSADEARMITLKIDFDNYVSEHMEEKIRINQQEELPFKKHFPNEDRLLYFIVLKKNNEITHMGFI